MSTKENVVVPFTGSSRIDWPPDELLQEAMGKLKRVVIIGYDNEGNEYFASSFASMPEIAWSLDRVKAELINSSGSFE